MRQSFTRKLITSPWMIAIFLTIAWGPLLIADFLSDVRPSLKASYALEGFALEWMSVTILCSVLAVAFLIGHVVHLILRLILRLLQSTKRS